MNSSNRKTEHSIREKLTEHEFEIDAGMWKDMDAMLDKESSSAADSMGIRAWKFFRNNWNLLSLLFFFLIGGLIWWNSALTNLETSEVVPVEESFSESKQEGIITEKQKTLNTNSSTELGSNQNLKAAISVLDQSESQTDDSVLKTTRQPFGKANSKKNTVAIASDIHRDSLGLAEKKNSLDKAINANLSLSNSNKTFNQGQKPNPQNSQFAENNIKDLDNKSVEKIISGLAKNQIIDSGNSLSNFTFSDKKIEGISSVVPLTQKSYFVEYLRPVDSSLFKSWNYQKTPPSPTRKRIKPHKKINRLFLGIGLEKAYFIRQLSQSIGELNFSSEDNFSKYKIGTLAYFQVNKKIRLQSEIWYYKFNLNYETDAALDSDPFFFRDHLAINRLEIPIGLHLKVLNRFRLSSSIGAKLNFVKTPKPRAYNDNEIYEEFYNAIPNSYNRVIAFYDFGVGYDWKYFSIDIRQRYDIGNFLTNVPYNGETHNIAGDNFQYVRIGISYFFGRHHSENGTHGVK